MWRFVCRRTRVLGRGCRGHPHTQMIRGVSTFTLSDVLMSKSSLQSTALVLLNVPFDVSAVSRLWDACALRVCADGASNRVLRLQHADGTSFVPDAVVGDMDSATAEV